MATKKKRREITSEKKWRENTGGKRGVDSCMTNEKQKEQ